MKVNFKKYGTIAIAIIIANLFLGNTSFGQSQTFNYTGTNQTFVVPSNVASVTVVAWGGGGGGGERNDGGTRFSGGGGGGGGYRTYTYTGLSVGNTFTISIGNGGAASNNNDDPGTDGNNTTVSISGFTDLVASGGSGGGAGTSSPGIGGTGGNIGSGPVGSSGIVGVDGSNGNASGSGGAGGAGGNDGGSGGTGAADGFGNSASAANVPGGGGGGANNDGFSDPSAGANGRVIITWTVCPTITASATKNDITCFDTKNGIITVSVPNTGISPFQYSIDNGIHYFNADGLLNYILASPNASFDATNKKFINLPVGTYQIRVKDANGCVSKSVQ